MTWSRQQRHKAGRYGREGVEVGAGHPGSRGSSAIAEPTEPRPPERPTVITPATIDAMHQELVLCECWVRHGQPRPHSATCPAYEHATGPIGDPQDMER